MSAAFIIPFNYQPSSNVAKKTTSYNVPSTSYALVEVVDPTGFTIDGVSPFFTKSVSLSAVTSGSVSKTFTPTGGFMGYTGTYTRNADGAGVACTGSVSDTSETLESFSKTGSQNGTYNLSGSFTNQTTMTFTLNTLSGVANGALTLSATVYFSDSNKFWVKPGTALVGNNYLVTLYTAIT